jgi:hypothetical protein
MRCYHPDTDTTMTDVTIRLTPETEQKLRQQAGRRGASLESYLQDLVEHAASGNGSAGASNSPLPSFEEMTAPFARDAGGMSDEEVGEFFEEVVREVRGERRASKGPRE